MTLLVNSDDDEGYEAASTSLLDRFETWLANEQPDRRVDDVIADDVLADANLLLDWRWQYGDGALTRWDTRDITEFLLEWCPRKLSVAPGDYELIPQSIALFMAFLGSCGLLAPGSSRPVDLKAIPVLLARAFVDEMRNPANFGMAKSVFTAASREGVDMTDEASFQRWIDDFNSRLTDVRKQLIAGSALGARPAEPPGPPESFAEFSAAGLLAAVHGTGSEDETFVYGRQGGSQGRLPAAQSLQRLSSPLAGTLTSPFEARRAEGRAQIVAAAAWTWSARR